MLRESSSSMPTTLRLCAAVERTRTGRNKANATTASIDAPEAEPIQAELEKRGWRLSDIFITHKHFDHIDGVSDLRRAYDCAVIGPKKSAPRNAKWQRMLVSVVLNRAP